MAKRGRPKKTAPPVVEQVQERNHYETAAGVTPGDKEIKESQVKQRYERLPEAVKRANPHIRRELNL